MNLDRLVSFFASSPSAKLLRSPHSAQIIFFLSSSFKDEGNTISPHSQLLQHLFDFQEELHATEPDILTDKPETYLANWSSGDSRWLRRFLDTDHSEPVYELTSHTEEVLKFLGEVLERNLGFVGTESRLKRIIDGLLDIVIRGSDDPNRRLEHLHAQRDLIDREIESIESGEAVETYGRTALLERFSEAVSDLASLQGDFRAVEELFRQITREVQQQQFESTGSRGEILAAALQSEDRLKESDQGISFEEFMKLVLSPGKQDEVEAIITKLEEIEQLAEQVDGMNRVRGMIGHLSEEAEKVMRTTRRLGSTLRRLLDTQTSASRIRLTQVLGEIKATAARLADRVPPPEVGIEVETELALSCPTERTFWSPPTQFETAPLEEHQPDEDDRLLAFRQFALLERLDWEHLKENIGSMFDADTQRVSLPQLLESHPLQSGAIEVLGYIQLAHDLGHEVDSSHTEVVRLEHAFQGNQAYEIPKVTFLSQRLRLLNQVSPTGDSQP